MDLPFDHFANPDVVLLDVVANTRAAALRVLHEPFAQISGVTDSPRFLRDMQERARLASICIASDVALPHARTTAVERIVLGVARLPEPGIMFDQEHQQVRLMFMIGTPMQQVEGYLKLVSRISRLLRTDGVRAKLLTAKSVEEFRAIMARGTAV